MRDQSDRYRVQTVPTALSGGRKRLGSYLVEAGLLSPAQIDVVLNDQKVTGMKFGEVIAARGWVKQKTIDYLMKKVVLPEREALKPEPKHQLKGATRQPETQGQSLPPQAAHGMDSSERRVPISKPLPSVQTKGEGVNWVG